MAKDPKQMTGYLYVLAAAVLWSLIGPFSKICMEEGLAPLEVAFWRALLGGICFFAQTGICGGARIPVKHALFFCLFGVLSISVFFSSLQISIQLSGAAMAMVLLYTAPAWVAVFSRILFHESFSSRKGIALGLALFGTALVCFSGGSLNAEPSVLGIVCGLISGLCYASHFPFYVWWQPRYSTATLYAYMLLGGALALFPFVDFAPTRSWTGVGQPAGPRRGHELWGLPRLRAEPPEHQSSQGRHHREHRARAGDHSGSGCSGMKTSPPTGGRAARWSSRRYSC